MTADVAGPERVDPANARARGFAAPMHSLETRFAAAVLRAHLVAIDTMRPVIRAGRPPRDAADAALRALYPALVLIGREHFPRIAREGWTQGNARLRAAARHAVRPRTPATARAALPTSSTSVVGVAFDRAWPELAAYLDARPVEYASAASATSVDKFLAILVEGAGLEIAAIVRQILGDQLPGVSRGRATTIARTEVLAAGNTAAQASYVASGVVTRHRWLSTRDTRTRESHRTERWPAGTTVVPLTKPFVLPSKARLMHPGDTSLGAPLAEIINCRCSVAPDVSLPGIPDYVPIGQRSGGHGD